MARGTEYREPQTPLSPSSNTNAALVKDGGIMGNSTILNCYIVHSIDSLIFTAPKCTYTSPQPIPAKQREQSDSKGNGGLFAEIALIQAVKICWHFS